ncbi:MAG: hypothetical protein HZB22_00020 [Deltaproteobacteria bacterium]|nr:hypothetical protein [Deltaproteobacteria bacterium]
MKALLLKTIIPLFLALCVLPGCARHGDEEEIRGLIRLSVEASEGKDLASLMKAVSKDYRDGHGNDYNGVKGVLLFQFMRPGNIKVYIRHVEVKVEGTTAICEVRAALLRGQDFKELKDIVPQDADVLRFNIIFKRERDGWKAVSAEWARAGLQGLL